VGAVAPTMFSDTAAREMVDPFVASISAFHPVGLRAMARAVAEADPHVAIPRSRLVILPGAGHICNVEAAPRFNEEVRSFLL
jgi:pimeloyl-ACP methyl ester carboxylesterase